MDPDRFSELYRRHHRAVWAYAVRRLPAGTDAADVAAEVFAVAWRRRDQLPDEPETLLWLYGTARRVVANATRAAGRRDRLTGRLASLRDAREPGAPPEDHPEVLAALDRLGRTSARRSGSRSGRTWPSGTSPGCWAARPTRCRSGWPAPASGSALAHLIPLPYDERRAR